MEILARSIGRRKEAVATLKIVKGTGNFFINNKIASDYLHHNSNNLMAIQAPLEILQKISSLEPTVENQEISHSNNTKNSTNGMYLPANLDIIVKVQGGGLVGQAEAIKLAVARAVCVFIQNDTGLVPEFPEILKKNLKDKGYLTQDARVKERRKYGLKKARKAPQYNKR